MKILHDEKERIEQLLISYLPQADSFHSQRCIDACRYSFLNGGKRIRPMLMAAVYMLANEEGSRDYRDIGPFMAAMEMIHTYSLIHDDLPAMDDDDLRRGKPTCHIAFDEAHAILAGDALLNHAFELMAKAMEIKADDGDGLALVRYVKANAILAEAAGIKGMIGGQVADMKYEHMSEANMDVLEYIHTHKTGAIIEAAMVMGAVLSGLDESMTQHIVAISEHLGLLFQIQDDILDATSTKEVLGKPIGSDVKNDKATYVTLYGLSGAKQRVEELSGWIRQHLEAIDPSGETLLTALITYIMDRKN